MSGLISAVAWVKRGVATQHPEKYVLDEKELQRVSALGRIEIEELEKAHEAIKALDRDEPDDAGDDDDDDDNNWVEYVVL